MKITLQTQVDKLTIAEGDVVEYSKSERTKRSLKTLGAFWGAAILSVLIPVLHFFLVPGLFLIGPVMAWVQYKKELKIIKLVGKCPECEKEITFQNLSGTWPLKQVCPLCSEQIHILSAQAPA